MTFSPSPAPQGADPAAGIDLSRQLPRVGFLLRLSQLRAYDALQGALGRVNLTPARYSVLAALHDNPDCRAGQIAEALRIKPSNMAGLLTQLEGEGLIQRRTDPSERRASRVRLTKAGVDLFNRVDPVVRRIDDTLLEVLSQDERIALLTQLAMLAGLG